MTVHLSEGFANQREYSHCVIGDLNRHFAPLAQFSFAFKFLPTLVSVNEGLVNEMSLTPFQISLVIDDPQQKITSVAQSGLKSIGF